MEYNVKKLKSSIKISETVIKIGLIASGLQLMYAFAYDSFLSWISAGFKATFIEVSVWILTQSMLRAHVLPGRSKIFLWALLVMIFLISTRANLQYELTNIAKSKDSFFETTGLGAWDYIDAWLRSALLPSIVLGLIYARVLISKGYYVWEREQAERKKRHERYVQYKRRQKKLERQFR